MHRIDLCKTETSIVECTCMLFGFLLVCMWHCYCVKIHGVPDVFYFVVSIIWSNSHLPYSIVCFPVVNADHSRRFYPSFYYLDQAFYRPNCLKFLIADLSAHKSVSQCIIGSRIMPFLRILAQFQSKQL